MECPECGSLQWNKAEESVRGPVSTCKLCGFAATVQDARMMLLDERDLLLKQRDALLKLVLRASTDADGVSHEGPGCFYCDREEHLKDCPAKLAIEAAGGKA